MEMMAIYNAVTGQTTYVEVIDDTIPELSEEELIRYNDAKRVEISTMAESTIMSPYQSKIILASTGKAHIYGVDRDDQRNMDSKLGILFGIPSINEQYWKTKYDGVVLHTRDEFIAVCLEIATHIEETIFKGVMLKELLESATTKQQIDAIKW